MPDVFTVRNVDLVFGSKPKKVFQAIDRGLKRETIQKNLRQIVGVQGVSLSVQEGEILVIMGLSGSGKSSLLRCFNGMNGRRVGALRGEILFRHPITREVSSIAKCSEKKLREIRRHEIAMVFQQFGLMPWRSVFENVAYPLEIQGILKREQSKRILEKLDLVGLSSWKDRYPHELSGGMQQRVGLARAFVTDAPVLLMDEPFSALDPMHRKHLQNEVLQLQKKLNKTIVFVTHDFSEATRIASRIAVMESGEILQVDTPEGLVSRPSCKRVSDFVDVGAFF